MQEGRHTRVYPGDSPPSAMRGWLTRLRGMITFNRHVAREGSHEIHDARKYREYKHGQRRARRSSHSRHRHGDGYERDRGYRRERHHPFMHFRHRCRPPYHGAHLRLWGFLTRKRDHIARGLHMKDSAERERRRERRRRQRRLAEEGLAIRLGAKTVLRTPRSHSHHRSRRHHREGFTPIATTGNISPGGYASNAIPVARSVGTHRGHHSDHGPPVVRTISRNGTINQVVPLASSHHVHSMPVSRAPSSRHEERVVPVLRSSSRHGSSRYGDPGMARTSSSRHGPRYQGHSRSPSEVYVS